ncbi:hypothetical protein BBK36DRAFT_5413 [Trichoderma citrinoviride]|uniref:Uncharacterized protein n=1 Tax=Trichoderma citrinoviride TaxID=58853 RepID=A0A2T4B9S1_9HYPO|nr:hypothetical protein BBK36DRAFT_5413 [Trichoderma citrinoviride]PTB66067.1 hypothetical protein BBK36DRAFT_5413 [Trichoderma citrinoviride]
MRPTIVTDNNSFVEPSRASFVDTADRPPAFNVRVDPNAPPMRSQSAAPYPVDDRMAPPPRGAPYPDDDGRPRLNNNYPPSQGPPADRPSSAFGIRPQGPGDGPRPLPGSQSAGNLYAGGPPPGAGRGRGGPPGPHGPGGYGPPNMGPPNMGPPNMGPGGGPPGQGRPYPPGDSRPGSAHSGNRMQNRPPQGFLLGHHRDLGPTALVAPVAQEVLAVLAVAIIQTGWALSASQADHTQEESKLGDLLQDMDLQDLRVPAVALDLDPTELALLLRGLLLKALALRPSKGGKSGPATFEDMGIPQGKQDGDCVIM